MEEEGRGAEGRVEALVERGKGGGREGGGGQTGDGGLMCEGRKGSYAAAAIEAGSNDLLRRGETEEVGIGEVPPRP